MLASCEWWSVIKTHYYCRVVSLVRGCRSLLLVHDASRTALLTKADAAQVTVQRTRRASHCNVGGAMSRRPDGPTECEGGVISSSFPLKTQSIVDESAMNGYLRFFEATQSNFPNYTFKF